MSGSTRVLIDGYAFGDSSAVRGIGAFLRRVSVGLASQRDLSVVVLAEAGARLPPSLETLRVRRVLPSRWRRLEHDLRLPAEIARYRPDVFLSPAQEPPRHAGVPWIQVLHDLIPLTWPHPLTDEDRRRWLRVGGRIRRAAAVATVSYFSAEEGVRHLGLDPDRVRVIPLGVDPQLFTPNGPSAEGPGPYLLHVAAYGPHKGFDEALAVIGRLAEAGLPHRLVLVGPHDDWTRRQVRQAIARSPRPDRVDFREFVEDLPAAYRGADAVLVTSRCEGFGLPVLEAMACGSPVVAFANSSLPEVVGDGGILIEDGGIEAMAKSIRRLITDPDLRDEMVARGAARARGFSWAKTISAYAELVRAVAASPQPTGAGG